MYGMYVYYIYIYICIYTYIHTYIHTNSTPIFRTHTHISLPRGPRHTRRAHIDTHIHKHMYPPPHLCCCSYGSSHVPTCAHRHTHTQTKICACTDVHTHTHTHTHKHTHTHTHTQRVEHGILFHRGNRKIFSIFFKILVVF